jgi:cytidine deaminase
MATPSDEIARKVEYLISRDASEDAQFYGQHLRDTFHLADVFVDGIHKQEMAGKLERFFCALFGRSDIAPSKEEYGMYAAKSASLRSSDLSRQVGAVVATPEGEVIAQGCNEVPKALGGTYWDLEEPDFRDVRIGTDPNEISKRELLRDLFERPLKAEMLSPKALELGNSADMVTALTRRADPSVSTDKDGPLVGSEVLDLTEYGRVVHAEMCAICDAARLGKSLKGAILYCTTFPCHNCTKHIIAAGIKKVVYMEPYPKSRAKELHQNEIDIEAETPNRVSFMPFLGISPFRYADIFQKGRRKNQDGSAKTWYHDKPRPMIDIVWPSYIRVEPLAYADLFGSITTQTPGVSEEHPSA